MFLCCRSDSKRVFELRDKPSKMEILATPEDSVFLVPGWCQ